MSTEQIGDETTTTTFAIHYRHVVGSFFDSKWAILPEAMNRMLPVVNNWAVGNKLDKSAVEALKEARAKPIRQSKGKIAVLPLFGVIAQRMNIMQALSEGGTSTEMFGAEFDAAMRDNTVGAIVINVDSPGGSVFGVRELADKIFNARGDKPIFAIANSLAASAAMWIASAVDPGRFFATTGGEVGSVGVFAMHVDQSAFNERVGLKPTFIARPAAKIEGNPHSALSEEAHATIQTDVDDIYGAFVDDLARFRGVKTSHVRERFGGGRVVNAKAAVESGMIDGIRTMDTLIDSLVKPSSSGKKSAELRLRRFNAQRRRSVG